MNQREKSLLTQIAEDALVQRHKAKRETENEYHFGRFNAIIEVVESVYGCSLTVLPEYADETSKDIRFRVEIED